MNRWLALLLVLFAPAVARGAEGVTVGVAISLREAMVEAADAHAKAGGGKVEFTFGASGQLAAQIRNGAPVDLFVSAAQQQVDDLVKAGAADADTRRVVAGNVLVLIVPADAGHVPASLADLAGARFRRVAVGEPRTVPAGQYAARALRSAKVDAAVAGRLVYGANVRQVLDYVRRGEVDAGLVYATDARQSGDKVRVAAVVDAALHEPIVYPAVVVSSSRKKDAAAKFLDFLAGEKGQSILRSHGFTPPPSEAKTPEP